jgi:hypothetical protein
MHARSAAAETVSHWEADLGKQDSRAREGNGKRKYTEQRLLTKRQEKFAQLLCDERIASQVQAYRLAYAVPDSVRNDAVYDRASRAAHHARIRQRVREIQAERARKEQRSLGLDAPAIRNFVLGNLYELATSAKSEQVRLGASRALGEVAAVSLFTHRSEVVHRGVGAGDLQVEIAERLRSLFGPVPAELQSSHIHPEEVDGQIIAVSAVSDSQQDKSLRISAKSLRKAGYQNSIGEACVDVATVQVAPATHPDEPAAVLGDALTAAHGGYE